MSGEHLRGWKKIASSVRGAVTVKQMRKLQEMYEGYLLQVKNKTKKLRGDVKEVTTQNKYLLNIL